MSRPRSQAEDSARLKIRHRASSAASAPRWVPIDDKFRPTTDLASRSQNPTYWEWKHLYQDLVRGNSATVIHQDRFILTDCAKKVLGALKDVLNRPKGVRPPCLAIIGGSNEGKSAVVRRFLQDYEAVTDEAAAGNTDQMRLVCAEMPPRATEPRTCLAIARALGLPGYGSTKSRVVSDNVYRALKAKRVEMLILNEAQHAAHLSSMERAVTCDLMKGISNLGISVVAVGTPELIPMLSYDVQVANRMRLARLVSFKKDEKLAAFLDTLATYYPLPESSDLGAEAMMNEIYKRTNGITGEVVQLCNAAAVLMPKHLIDAKRLGGEPTWEIVQGLIDEFEVSPISAAIRYVELAKQPVIAVFSDGRNVRWWRENRQRTGGLWLESQQSLAIDSVGYHLSATPGHVPVLEEVPWDAWFPHVRAGDDRELFELAAPLDDEGTMLSLLWIPSWS